MKAKQIVLKMLILHLNVLQVGWGHIRSLKLAVWLKQNDMLRAVLEQVAKNNYIASDKDPFSTVLPYLACGKDKLAIVRSLFRVSPKHQKVFSLLQNDFSEERLVTHFRCKYYGTYSSFTGMLHVQLAKSS
jgi:hypothetical protein